MLWILMWVGIAIGGLILMWDMYVAAMHVKKVQDSLGPVARIYGMSVLVRGYLLDVLFNWTLFTAIFLDPPREMTITHRLKRYRARDPQAKRWRSKMAKWICTHCLNQFDTKPHC